MTVGGDAEAVDDQVTLMARLWHDMTVQHGDNSAGHVEKRTISKKFARKDHVQVSQEILQGVKKTFLQKMKMNASVT